MTGSRNIKIWLSLACLASSLAAPAPYQPVTLDIIDMAAISRMTPQQLEVLAEGLAAEEIMRTKRSSSAQALTSVVSKASAGLQSKVGLLGQASAFISSASSGSKGHDEHDEHTGYSYEPHDNKVDFWGLKKSILYTLFQAVKAITGGVTILKGQLIKGGGALAATLGKVISSKGDVVSNIGKKIVSSAALVQKPHKPHSTAVYGPPPVEHGDYPPSAYGAPTAPAHYSAPSAHSAPISSGYSSPVHKYPSSLDGGRGKLQAGLVILAPLDHAHNEILNTAHSSHGHGYDHPSTIVDTVYSAVQNALPPSAPTAYDDSSIHLQAPPLPYPVPSFKPMHSYQAINSYGEPAAAEAFPDYDPRNPHPPFHQPPKYYAMNKLSSSPIKHVRTLHSHKTGLTKEKIEKINFNLKKIASLTHKALQRSSEESPKFTGLDAYAELLRKCQIALLPTQVVTDAEIGVVSAEKLPDPTTSSSTTSTTTSTTSTTTTTTTEQSTTSTTRQKKDVQYFLRGNKIVIHG